jgi:hypothetical protein
MRRAVLKIHALHCIAAIAAGVMIVAHLLVLPAPGRAADPTTHPSSPPRNDPARDDPKAIHASFANLASPDPAVRTDALSRLMGLEATDLPMLRTVVEESRPLAAAQTSVLEQIVTHVFLTGETYESNLSGFLGIKMEAIHVTFTDLSARETAPSGGMVVFERMPGFPGARMLLDGDVILAVLDRPQISIQETDGFAAVVRDMGAGSTVHFLILRHGQIVRVAVKLASRPNLADNFNEMSALLVERRKLASEYWTAQFAPLLKEPVS